jgi:hypothetical protein
MSSHFARAAGSAMRTFRKSDGTLCTAPGEIPFLVMDFILHRYAIGLRTSQMRANAGHANPDEATRPPKKVDFAYDVRDDRAK